mgnify:CR=1 FL=1
MVVNGEEEEPEAEAKKEKRKQKEKNETRKRNVHTLIRVLRKLRSSTCLKFYTSIYFLILRETNALFLFHFANWSVHS